MFLRKHIKHLLAEILLGWKYYTVRRNRNRQVVEARSLKKSYQLFRVFVIELQRQQKLKLKGHITKIVNKNSLIEADYKNNLEQMQSIDEEKLEFKQKIIELQAQLQMEHEELLQEKSNTVTPAPLSPISLSHVPFPAAKQAARTEPPRFY